VRQIFARGAVLYGIWALVVILVQPWWFGGEPDPAMNRLPVRVEDAIYGRGYPILLKCYDSPHVYLLERGSKRWVKDIPTFEAQGFSWEDVLELDCPTLRKLPDGPPIPPDAGPPPVPYAPYEDPPDSGPAG